MTKIREILERNGYGNGMNRDMTDEELKEQLDSYFEDVTFTIETIESMDVVTDKARKRLASIRRDLTRIGFEIKKEFGK